MTTPVRPDDLAHMATALDLAARVPHRPWPNPPVGAVVVRGNDVVGRGAHQGPGTRHAEAVALDEAGSRARGATLYCTLEPCNHQGRMPPCAPRIAESGIARVVVAVLDPNPKVAGGGLGWLKSAGLDVTCGVRADEALELIWPFVVTRAFDRPFVLLKTATSLDGRFAPGSVPEGRAPFYLTGEAARADVHRLRRWSDVVLVGGRTARADRPRLDARLLADDAACPASDPLPAVASARPECLPGFRGRSWLLFTASVAMLSDEAASSGCRVIACAARGHQLDLRSLVEEFGRQAGQVLMIEAGPALATALLQEDLVDRWVSYVAPRVLGGGVSWPAEASLSEPASFSLTRVEQCGGDLKLTLDREDFAATQTRLGGAGGER